MAVTCRLMGVEDLSARVAGLVQHVGTAGYAFIWLVVLAALAFMFGPDKVSRRAWRLLLLIVPFAKKLLTSEARDTEPSNGDASPSQASPSAISSPPPERRQRNRERRRRRGRHRAG